MYIDPSALIGPHYTADIINLESASLDDRIALFEDRVRGYFTTPTRLLAVSYEHSVFLVLLVVSMCIEWLEIFHQGQSSKGRSKSFFKSGFRRIFNPSPPNDVPEDQFEEDLDKMLDEIYYQIRSGLVHTGTTRSKVLVTGQIHEPLRLDFNPITRKVERIQINPFVSLLSIDFHLSEYCTALRKHENDELRLKFNQAWDNLIVEE
jgi:hypothetical protein